MGETLKTRHGYYKSDPFDLYLYFDCFDGLSKMKLEERIELLSEKYSPFIVTAK